MKMMESSDSHLFAPSPPTPHTFHLSNNFTQWPTYFYPDYQWLYCTNGHWIPGERNLIIGSIYIAEYIFFLALYFPALLVISSPGLLCHSCYKMMLAIGLLDIYNGFFVGFFAGLFSIMGANYCDNTMLLTGGREMLKMAKRITRSITSHYFLYKVPSRKV